MPESRLRRTVLASAAAIAFPTLAGAPIATQEPVSAAHRAEVIDAIVSLLESDYIYEDRGRAYGTALRRAADSGAFDGAETPQRLATLITERLLAESSDAHLRVWYEPADADADPASTPAREPDPSYGFRAVSLLEGNVGYLDLRGFAGSDAARPVADAALRYLSPADALIIDLRRNGGGGPWMVRYLSAFLFSEPTHLVSTWFRGLTEARERWTADDLGVPARPDLPVFILTSGRTFSAAESFTFGLVVNDRVTVVGERTGGGGHFGSLARLPHGFVMFVPEGRTYDPRTGEGWEAEGIAPHVPVPAAEALVRAHELALGTGLRGAGRSRFVAAWSGEMEDESESVRLTVQIQLDASGELTARWVDHQSQVVRPLVLQQDSADAVRLEYAPAGLVMTARLGGDDAVLVGTFAQRGDERPLRLERR